MQLIFKFPIRFHTVDHIQCKTDIRLPRFFRTRAREYFAAPELGVAGSGPARGI